MNKVCRFIFSIATAAALLPSAASVARAGERATYLNIGPGAATPAPPSPPASGGSSGLSNTAADTNGRSGSSFCQQPVYDNWGNVTGYRQGGC